MSERTFDNHWGVRTQKALINYLRWVARYNEAVQTAGSIDEMSVLELEVQRARDAYDEQQRYTRSFECVFHRLDKVSTEELKDSVRRYQKYMDELPTDFTDPSFVQHHTPYPVVEKESAKIITAHRATEKPVLQQREFLENALYEMKAALASRELGLSSVDAIAAQVRLSVEIEARLRRQCEEDVQKYPDQEETIRRSYRKAIDALREEG